MRTHKANLINELSEKHIEKAISRFSYHLLSNSKWVKLIEKLVDNIDSVSTIEFKHIVNNKIGQIYLDKDSTFGFDYWENGFEGQNSMQGWLYFKEIEYLKFSKNPEQDILKIKKIIESVGQFEFIENESELILLCYK